MGAVVQGKARARAAESWSRAPTDRTVIAVVDDHRLVTSMLSQLLESAGHSVVDAYASTPGDIVAKLGAARPWITFVDHDLGSAGLGIGLVDAARRHGLVVALTASDDRLVHAWYLEAGADGVIPKTAGPMDVLATIELARAGEPITPDPVRQQLLAELRTARSMRESALRPFAALTQRESETLFALGDGAPAAQIAEDWVVALATVRSHIRSILLKLGVSSQLEAVAMAHRAGWFRTRPESPMLMMTPLTLAPTMTSDERKSAG